MNYKYYSETKIINGATTVGLMPESQRPTYNQFYYYCSKHITEQEKDLIKTSAAEQRNNSVSLQVIHCMVFMVPVIWWKLMHVKLMFLWYLQLTATKQ